ncbi:AraC family transcriptional regulator [Bacillus sp. Hm123]|uniref:AraC family transcriptional regulator n=1 Tax=Bacillus sp. Hm123 TaxID=3450745 RepID=UPI003F43CCA9
MHFFQAEEGHFHFQHIVHITSKHDKKLQYEYTQNDALIFCRKAKGNILINDQVFTIHSPSAFFIPVKSFVQLNVKLDQNEDLYMIFFNMYSTSQFEPEKYLLQAHSVIFGLLRQLYLQNQSTIAMRHLQNSVLLAQLILELAIDVGQNQHENSIEIIKQYIDEHYAEPIQIPQLAMKLGVSEPYFMEHFKKQYGCTVIEYVTNKRMQEAKKLLATGRFSVKEVGSIVGYNDEFYFSRRFKKITTISPSHFAKTRKRKIAILDSSIFNILTPIYYVPTTAPIHPTWRSYYYNKYELQIAHQLLIGRDEAVLTTNVNSLITSGNQYDYIITIQPIPQNLREPLEKLGNIIEIHWEQPWRKQLLYIANVLGENMLANKWIDNYESLAKKANKQLSAKVTGPLLFLLVKGDHAYIYRDRNIHEVVEDDLQLSIVHPFDDVINEQLCIEQIANSQPFAICVLLYDDEESCNTWNTIQKDDNWLEIIAVRENRVYMISPFPWRDYGAQAHFLMLEQLFGYL